ncbi:hypothetical protein FSP39_005010 [Pinctada imbricata]|uniref:G-protein coupled receptors family 1 profile domain-containing protein n=1 Tax=Pinctada imbricata TaxID=66713 RepID=A0AA89BY21_PINIB|nr:hypothetical protein FSP39_005010 [Pinctada imbricata]
MDLEYFEFNETIFEFNQTDEYYFYYNLDNYFGSSAAGTFGVNPAIKGVLVFLYAVIIFVSLVGNVFICLSYKKEVIQRTNTNLFILAISINDIIQILFEPFLAISNIIFYSWPYASFTCPLVVYVQFVTVNFKAFILVAMTCEKYIAITMPTRRCYQRRVAYAITIALFLAAALVALPTALYTRVSFEILAIKGHGLCLEMWQESSQKYIYSIATMILQYFLPILVMGVSYTHIIVILQRHRIPGEPMQDRDQRLMKSKKKAVKMLIAIFVCYAVVWLPLHIITIIGDLNIGIYDQNIVHWAFKIRTSKFRHIYGRAPRKEHCFENIQITRNAHDSNFCCVNPKNLAVVTETGGGGSFTCLPVKQTGRVDANAPRVCGHAGQVLDVKWNPFNDDIIASASEDCSVKLWRIPDGGLRANLSQWEVDLHGHQRRVSYIEWHPAAENILLSAGFDFQCILWNVEQAEPVNIISCHDDTIFSVSWNKDGSLFTTSCKDKVLRVLDPRIGDVAAESTPLPNQSARSWKAVYLGDTGKIFSTFFSKSSDRNYAIWDVRNMSKPVKISSIDSSSGILLPYYDLDTKVMYLAGKGDSSISYFELVEEDPFCHYLDAFQSPSPQRGFGVMPKRGCDTSRCEVMRFYKLHASKNLIEPISMIVPRKSEQFHADIFPPTASTIPSLSADEWISGQSRDPILISMQNGHVVNNPKLTAAKAVQKQDGTIIQAPTITTYKAVGGQGSEGAGTKQANSNTKVSTSTTNRKSLPASLRNIRQLSTNQDYVSIQNNNVEVNGYGENNGVTSPTTVVSSGKEEVTSPTSKGVKKVWSPTSPKGPTLDNGLQGNDNDKATHVKKTWSLQDSSVLQEWHAGLPQNERELRKAYFRQLEEINSLKEQISLKDKRIRQLEQELSILKLPSSDCGPGQSDC